MVGVALWVGAAGCATSEAAPTTEEVPAEAPSVDGPTQNALGTADAPTVLASATAPPVPSATVTASADVEAPPPPPCAPEMVHIGRYCIDKYEAHLITVDPDGVVRQHPHHLRPPQDRWYAAHSAPDVMPQAYISRKEAAGACERAGKRLCRWLEWRRACQGRTWRRYPYAHGGRRGVCNTGRKHLLHELFEKEKPWGYEEHFNSPLLSLTEGYLAPSGAFEGCVSEDGVHDMNGNLHEWVSTTVTDDFIERMENEDVERVDQPWQVGNGMFLGGFYSTTNQHGPGCFYTTVAHEPTYHDYSTGFRCCADAVKPDKAN